MGAGLVHVEAIDVEVGGVFAIGNGGENGDTCSVGGGDSLIEIASFVGAGRDGEDDGDAVLVAQVAQQSEVMLDIALDGGGIEGA
jgi:hypothetical protein